MAMGRKMGGDGQECIGKYYKPPFPILTGSYSALLMTDRLSEFFNMVYCVHN
jgi:hypothetical protein